MAPEQAGYLVAGSRAWHAPCAARRLDVYGIGAILYELLAGEPPCQARTREQVLRRSRRAKHVRCAGSDATSVTNSKP